MKIKKETLILMLVIIISVIWVVIEWILLPEKVAMQITSDGGVGNVMPKAPGIAIPFVISTVFILLYRYNNKKKYLYVSILGLVIPIFTLVVNL